jgi:hypothetical protein
MDKICKQLRKYKPSEFVRVDDIPFPTNISCHDEIKQTFSALPKSSQYTWNGNKVTFYYNEEHCDTLFAQIDRLLQVIQPANYPLTATILLSSAKKYYPNGKVFGPLHVNTGYASDEGIVVYRKEEWFKVFIHECFHFFHFDALLFDSSFPPRILSIFKVNSQVNLYEAYCEIWARMLNCCMISVVGKINLTKIVAHEKKYARRHMVNVLHHMGLKYSNLKEKCDFKEDTNVFAYVVLTALLLNKNYLEDFKSHRDNFTLTNAEGFVRFLEWNHEDDAFLNSIHHIRPMQTTTMSLYRIDDYITI